MCVNQIVIRNKFNRDRYAETYHGTFLLPNDGRVIRRLPCGKCDACLQAKRDSLYLRCRNEYQYTSKRILFVTLTYDSQNLPKVNFVETPDFAIYETTKRVSVWGDDSNKAPFYYKPSVETEQLTPSISGKVTCWDKSHVQKYLKSLNEKLLFLIGKSLGINRLHHGKLTKEWLEFLHNTPRPLKYLCVCERGHADVYVSDKGRKRMGTSRPHYHLLLFLQDKRVKLDIFKYLVRKTWSYGHVYPLVVRNDKGEKVRDEYGSMRYVCKYISKNEGFAYPLKYKDLDGSVKTKYVNPDDIIYQSHADELRYKPFTLVSNFLGIEWLNNVDTDYIVDTLVNTGVKDTNSVTGKTRSINLPSYYINKIRYKQLKYSDDAHNADTRHYLPQVFENLDNLVSNLRYLPIWDTFTGIPCFVGYEYVPTTSSKYVNIPTQYYNRLQTSFLHNKAEFYVHLLQSIQISPSLFWQYVHKANLDTFETTYDNILSQLLAVENLDDFYLYLVQDSDINYSPYDNVYNILIALKNAMQKEKFIINEIKYKASLNKSIMAKPDLCNINPLI